LEISNFPNERKNSIKEERIIDPSIDPPWSSLETRVTTKNSFCQPENPWKDLWEKPPLKRKTGLHLSCHCTVYKTQTKTKTKSQIELNSNDTTQKKVKQQNA